VQLPLLHVGSWAYTQLVPVAMHPKSGFWFASPLFASVPLVFASLPPDDRELLLFATEEFDVPSPDSVTTTSPPHPTETKHAVMIARISDLAL
jgi:hypothetical protein